MRKVLIGLGFGAIAGILDVIPMILQNLTWDANISAFSMWIIIGFLISTTKLEIPSILKGELFAFLSLAPSAVLIGWKQPFSLIPIFIMTAILGGLLGICIDKISNLKG